MERWKSTLNPEQKPPGDPSPWQPPRDPIPSMSFYPPSSSDLNPTQAQVTSSPSAVPQVSAGNGVPTATWRNTTETASNGNHHNNDSMRTRPEPGDHQRRRSTSIFWNVGNGSDDDDGDDIHNGRRKPPSPNGSFPDPVYMTSSPPGPAPCQYNISIKEPPSFRPEAYASYKHEIACWQEIHTQFPQYSLVAAIASSATGTHQRLMTRFLKETRTCLHERTLKNLFRLLDETYSAREDYKSFEVINKW